MTTHVRTLLALAVALVAAAAGVATAGVSPFLKCQADKNNIAGQHAACRQKAEADRVKTGDLTKHAAALAKCDATFAAKWAKAESKAGGACPTNGDETEIRSQTGQHTDTVATMLSGVPLPICGNALLESGEDCELGIAATCAAAGKFGGLVSCAPHCSVGDTSMCRTWVRVFVTSSTHQANFGGLAGGDAICQARADAAFLGGRWRAWLSTTTVDARDRINGAEYRLVDDTTIVASSWADLLDGTITNNIDKDEHGLTVLSDVWTSTNQNGTGTGIFTCTDWTRINMTPAGNYGSNNFPPSSMVWSNRAQAGCDFAMHLYCFEHLPFLRVFVTSTGYNGALGGLSGADAKCQERAAAAGLGGSWTAWLSSSTVDAKDRVVDAEYRRLDGALVALDKADLLDGAIIDNITVNELGGNSYPNVWTGTRADGTGNGDFNCGDWTDVFEVGSYGKNDFPPNNWTEWHTGVDRTPCSTANLRLYCFEK